MEFRTGDILSDDAEALVNTVNCVGVMGRGIALQFKKAFPDNYKAYLEACNKGVVQPGRMFVYETGKLTPPKFIINFPTKRHWRGRSRIEDIQAGLVDLKALLSTERIRSIAIPPLGIGLGGLEWNEVKELIEASIGEVDDIRVTVYEPEGAPSPRAMSRGEIPKMTPGRAALVALMDRYLRGFLDPSVTLLEVHKLMYFLQEAGEPLRLSFKKAIYGPYAENLRHVLTAVEGYYVSGYADGGDQPGKELELVPGAVEDAVDYLSQQEEARRRIERVAELIDGYESSFGLELLATVHWITQREVGNSDAVVERVHAWGARKKQFTPRQIRLALATLTENGWVETH
jgi:O-acetyl-ADP-ribose deacetylase (regulator of RNase III)